MIKNELFRGGIGEDFCAGCTKVWVLPPDINWQAIDPIGPQRKLKATGTNVFKPTQPPADFSDVANYPSDWLVVGYDTIGQTASYTVGRETIGGTEVETACVSIVANLLWPGGPFRRPAVSILDGSGMKVTLTLGEEIASSMWEATAEIHGSRRQTKPPALFDVRWTEELVELPWYGTYSCWPLETGPLAIDIAVPWFWDFEPNLQGFRNKRSSRNPNVPGGGWGSLLGTAKNGRVRLGCDFQSLLTWGTATAETPEDWSPTGDAPGFFVVATLPNSEFGSRKYQVEEIAYGKTVNGCEAGTGTVVTNINPSSRIGGSQSLIHIYHNFVAVLSGTTSAAVEWRPWSHSAIKKYEGAPLKTDYYFGPAPFDYSLGMIKETVSVFCSPESGRGIANAFGTFVTFAHSGEKLPTSARDFGYRAEIAVVAGTAVTAANVDYTESDAISRRSTDSMESGALKAYVVPRVIESTAPPVLPSTSSDVVDAEQCMHIDWNGPTDSPRFFGGYYRDAACDCQLTAEANAEEHSQYHSPESASPQVNLMPERQRTFAGCVKFTGAHRHFTLPMTDSQDVSSVSVTIELAADQNHLQFARDCPGYRGTLFDKSYPLKADGTPFMPGASTAFGYVMNSMVCGEFLLSKNRPDGKWLGANRFCYRGEAADEEVTVKASNRREAYKTWDRSTGATMPVPQAGAMVAAKECIDVSSDPCEGVVPGGSQFVPLFNIFTGTNQPAGGPNAADPSAIVIENLYYPQPFDSNMSDDCKKFLKVMGGSPFCDIKGMPRHYHYPVTTRLDIWGFPVQGWDFVGAAWINVPTYGPEGVADNTEEPDLCYVFFGTDWKAVAKKASISLRFEGSQNGKPPGVNSEAEMFYGDFQYEGIPRENKYKPRLNVYLGIHVRCRAWCDKQYFDRHQMIWKNGTRTFEVGNKIDAEEYSERIAESTFGWSIPSGPVALTYEQTQAFYDRQPVELYIYNVDNNGGYAVCTAEEAASRESLKITLQAE